MMILSSQCKKGLRYKITTGSTEEAMLTAKIQSRQAETMGLNKDSQKLSTSENASGLAQYSVSAWGMFD
jgi:hypothetical protein